MTERQMTEDEKRGVSWWNELSEHERSTWCERARTAVPAEAWSYFKRVIEGR